MLAENPDIARLRSWRYREGRDDLIVGIGGRREDHIDLTGREASQRGIDIDIDRSEFAQFQLQDFDIPAGLSAILLSAIRSARFWTSERPDRRTQVGETSPGRVLPVVFDVRHKSKHDVDRTVPDDLAIDMSSRPI